jgi:hypothetical protein
MHPTVLALRRRADALVLDVLAVCARLTIGRMNVATSEAITSNGVLP